MEAFEKRMMDGYINYNVVLLVVMIFLAVATARKLPQGIIGGFVGLILTFVIALVVSALAIYIYSLPIMTNIVVSFGAVAWSLETGVEYAPIPILAALCAYVIARLRTRQSLRK